MARSRSIRRGGVGVSMVAASALSAASLAWALFGGFAAAEARPRTAIQAAR